MVTAEAAEAAVEAIAGEVAEAEETAGVVVIAEAVVPVRERGKGDNREGRGREDSHKDEQQDQENAHN